MRMEEIKSGLDCIEWIGGVIDKTGVYQIKSYEADFEIETIKVFERRGKLIADCPSIGVVGVSELCEGLTDFSFRRIGNLYLDNRWTHL